MLRPAPEVVASAVKSYGTWQSDASRAMAWINVALETERVTRGEGPRAFVRYEDLLGGWREEIDRVGESLSLPLITEGIAPERARAVDEFVDPNLHRNRVDWGDLDVPPRVVELADRAWGQLLALDLEALDATRAEFAALHAEAEAIAQSAITAAKRSNKPAPKQAAPAAEPTLRVRVARRIPKRYRRRIRGLLGR
jgi:hypothetical protein